LKLGSNFQAALRRVTGWVHASAKSSPLERARREFFILSRLATSAFAGLLVAPFLALNAPLHAWAPLALIWVFAPLAAVTWLLRGGSLAQAQFVWQVGLLTLAAIIAFAAGFAHGAALICLLLIPLEAAVSEALPVQLLASGAAATFMLIMFGAQYGGFLSGADGYPGVATEALSAPAAVYLLMLLAGAQRIHALRKRIEESHAMHARVLAEVIGDLVLRFDSVGAVISASGGASAQFGLEPDELLGTGLFDRVHVCDRLAYMQAIDDCASCDATVNIALRLRTNAIASAKMMNPEPVFSWAEMRLHRLGAGAAGGDEAALVCVMRNVTEAKAFESKLQTARAEAESASSWKDRLLANVSHELRTPLNAIIGFSEILCRAELTPSGGAKQREYAGIIHTSAEHLLSVVNLILDMSKIDAGRFEISPEPFELAPLIAACCDMLRLKADAGGVALIRAPLNCPGEIVADKRAFRQVLINLLSNAVKFTRRDGQVVIGAEMSGDLIHLSILDTGIGIAEDHLPQLGDPFFQARASYDRLFEGTGLGLSLVRGLVSLLGGSLLVESVAEVGTRVTVRLPVDCRGSRRVDGPLPRIETAARFTSPFALSKSPDMVQEKKIA
jgi:two-component system, cell cycle sensor histidine kinase DivJ